MRTFEEYKNEITHKDRLLKSWWENIGKWRAPDKTNEGIWHRIRDIKTGDKVNENDMKDLREFVKNIKE